MGFKKFPMYFNNFKDPTYVQRLDAEERIALYRWLRSIWWDCSAAIRSRFDGIGGRILRALHPPLPQTWRRQTDALLDLGLMRPDELELLERTRGTR